MKQEEIYESISRQVKGAKLGLFYIALNTTKKQKEENLRAMRYLENTLSLGVLNLSCEPCGEEQTHYNVTGNKSKSKTYMCENCWNKIILDI